MPVQRILHTISRRVIFAVGIVLIAVLVFATVIVVVVLRNDTLDRAGRHLENLATVLGEQSQQLVQSIEIISHTTADEIRNREAGNLQLTDRQLFDHIQDRMTALPDVRAMGVIDARGDAVLHSSAFPAPVVNYADREYFRAHSERRVRGLHVGEPVFGRVTREWLNVFSWRIEDERGQFKGVVFAAVHMPYFERLFGALNLGRGGRVFLFRDDGILLATYPAVENAVGRTFAQDPLFREAIARSAPGAHRRAGLLDQEPRVLASSRLKDYPLRVTVSSAESFILGEWRRDAWRIGAGAAGAGAFLGIALFFLLRQHRLAEAMAAEAREAEQRWRAAIEAAGHGAWDWNVKSGEIYRSPHYHEMLGYAEHEIPAHGEGWKHLLHPDDRQLSHHVNQACLDGRQDSFSAELRLRCKDGTWKWVLNRGTVTGRDARGVALRVLGTITDLTAHRQAQQQVRESEARLNAIIGSAMDAIITVDESQNVVLFNNAAERIFRCTAAEAIGGPLDRFIPERFRPAHRRHVEQFGRTGTTTRMMGARLALFGVRGDGEEFSIDASISQITVEGKKLYTVILRDITERKAAETALERSHAELRELSAAMHEVREAERLRIARELHDELAQWLTAIRMDVSWLAARLPREQAPLVDRTEKMKQVVDTTVAAVRRIAADLRPVMLDDLGLVAALESLLHDLSQRTGIIVSLDADAGELDFGEPLVSSLYRIAQEALTNVARHAQATEAQVAVRIDGDRLVMEVRDNGLGFDPEYAARRKSYGILGIRERAHTLGGAARVERVASGGTLVEIVIPAARYRRRKATDDQSIAG